MEWFIKLHRKTLLSEIWEKPPEWFKVWSWLLMNVRYNTISNNIQKWCILTKYDYISQQCSVKTRTVENCFRWLKESEMVVVRKRSRFVLIEVINWDSFQDDSGTKTEQRGSWGGRDSGTIIKEGRKKKEYISEYEDFIKENDNLSSIIIKVFLNLWYKPNESLDEFREWVKSRILETHNIPSMDIMKWILDRFYDYWIEQTPQKRKTKNWKSTLSNSFELKEFRK